MLSRSTKNMKYLITGVSIIAFMLITGKNSKQDFLPNYITSQKQTSSFDLQPNLQSKLTKYLTILF